MAINKKLIHFKNKEAFDRELQAGNIMDTSICWIPDAKFIYTRGTYWYCSSKSDAEIQQLISDIETQLSNKVDKVEGKGLSTNDFTDDLLNLLKKVSKPLNYKGSVPTYNDLPIEGNLEGDVWNVTKTDVNYAWTGTDWDPFGSSAVNIVDDLTTGGTSAALSAEQGKVLKDLVDTKVDKVSGKQLSTNDYTTADKKKFESLPIGLATDLIPVQDSPEYLGINLIGYSFKESEGIYKPHEPIIRTINPATKTAAGVMTAQDKVNLDETLPNAIAQEVQDRKDADTALDQKLSQAIKEEADARAEYDDNMMVMLGEEEDARKAADTALETKLQSDINAEETRAMLAESENLAIIKAETERALSLIHI